MAVAPSTVPTRANVDPASGTSQGPWPLRQTHTVAAHPAPAKAAAGPSSAGHEAPAVTPSVTAAATTTGRKRMYPALQDRVHGG
jgi:hypothetical protein